MVKPCTILLLNHTAEVSGAEHVMLDLLPQITAAGFHVVVAAPAGELESRVKALGVRYVTLPSITLRFGQSLRTLFAGLRSMQQAIRAYRQVMQQEQPDLLHSNTTRAGLAAILANPFSTIPMVQHVHDMLPAGIASSFVRGVFRLRRNTCFVAVSHAASVRFNMPSQQSVVIPNAVDAMQFTPNAAARTQHRAALQLSPEAVAIGCIGQFAPRKRQLELLHAFGASNALRRAQLYFVGTARFHAANDTYYQRCQAEAAQYPNIHFLGSRQDLPQLLNAFDLTTLNSSDEPFGLAAAESLACGIPVVAPAVDGLVDIVDDQVTGILAPAQDTAALIAALVTLQSDPARRQQMAQRGPAAMVERFAPSMQISRMLSVYQRMLATRDTCNAYRQEAA